jgi:hypothetical protein
MQQQEALFRKFLAEPDARSGGSISRPRFRDLVESAGLAHNAYGIRRRNQSQAEFHAMEGNPPGGMGLPDYSG